MQVKALTAKRLATRPRKHAMQLARADNKLTIRDLGWGRECARQVRAKLASFAPDWDDPSMDVYDAPLTG